MSSWMKSGQITAETRGFRSNLKNFWSKWMPRYFSTNYQRATFGKLQKKLWDWCSATNRQRYNLFLMTTCQLSLPKQNNI
jgi:hypothetical protein